MPITTYYPLFKPQNLLTLLRVPAALLVLICYEPDDRTLFAWFLATLTIAALSDKLDGVVARYRNEASDLGYTLDGFCDRVFHIGMALALYKVAYVPLVVVWLLITRDVAIYAIRLSLRSWQDTGSRLRLYSVVHGYGFRFWALFFVLADTNTLFFGGASPPAAFYAAQDILIWIILIVSYIGIFKMLREVFSVDDEAVQAKE